MTHLFSSGIVIFYIENNTPLYLLLHYPHGHWDLPKGKIEMGETKEQAALRELKEETGLTAQIIPGFSHEFSYFFKQDGQTVRKTVTFLLGKTDQKQVSLSVEHVGHAWLPFQQAHENLTYPNAKELLQKANQFLENFTDI